jgi:protein-disulfide isomerase
MENQPRPLLTVPVAIIIAAAIIAGAIIYIERPIGSTASQQVPTAANGQPDTSALPAVSTADHILGNPNATIKIVEYSDPSCPYCKLFQTTMLEIMQTYGASGQVAWIYRQFPLDKPDANGNVLHPNSGAQANAFECAASVGGNAGFWAYEKDWFSTFPEDGADETSDVDNQQITQAAIDTNLDTASFKDCVSGDSMSSKLDKSYQSGLALGIDGTPTIYIVTPTGSPIMLQGAQSYGTMKTAIDTILASMNQTASSTASQ